MMTRWVAWGALATMALLGGCMTIRSLGGAESCCKNPEECEWVVVKSYLNPQEMLFLCCKSPGRDIPHCTQAMWLGEFDAWME